MRRIFIMLILVMVFLLSACGGSSTTYESNLSCAENASAVAGIDTALPLEQESTAWINISSSSSHFDHLRFVLRQDGRLFAWGSSQRLQTLFGNAVTEGQDAEAGWTNLQAVEVMDNVAYVSSGGGHTMILDTDGVLWGVGSNNHGQLGEGTIAQRPYPIRVMDNVVAVSAGNEHTMAITTDGGLWAWGENGGGQLGDGTNVTQHSPIRIMEDVIAISAGDRRSAAITSDGRLWVWGNCICCMGGMFHEVYLSGETIIQGSPGRVNQPWVIMYDVVAVSAAEGSHSMAITSDGGLWAWGHNVNGQLGNGFNTNQPDPIRVKDNVMMVSVGSSHTAAITTDGVLYTWGNNGGQLGDGTTATRHLPTRIMDNVAFVYAGNGHTMAITQDGALWAWGRGNNDVFGLGEDFAIPNVVNIYK